MRDCTCYAPDDAEPEDHDGDCPERPECGHDNARSDDYECPDCGCDMALLDQES